MCVCVCMRVCITKSTLTQARGSCNRRGLKCDAREVGLFVCFLVLHLRRASLTRAGRVPRTVTCLPASDAFPSRGRCPRHRDRKEKQTERGADAVLGWPGGCACGCARVAGSVRPGRSHHTGHVHAALAWQTPWARAAGSHQRVLAGKEMLTAPRELPGPDMSSFASSVFRLEDASVV